MDIRIRRIFGPLARVVALLLERMKVTLRVPLSISVFTSLLAAFSFYLLSLNPRSADLVLVVTILMFLSGLLDEITRQLADLKQKKLSELERVFLGLDRYMDLPIVLSALYFLRERDFQIGFLNFGLTVDHLLVGAAFFVGVYLAGFTARKRTNTPGLETRAERAFYLTAFMITGYTHEAFPIYLLIGIISLGIFLYLASFYSTLKSHTKEGHLGYEIWKATRPFKHLLVGILDLTKNVIAFFLNTAAGLFRRREEQADAEEEPEEKPEYVSPQGHSFTALITDGGSSQPIVNAKVALKNKETGKVLRSKTNQAGKCEFSGIAEGEYAIKVEADGFKVEEFERFLSMDSGEVFVLSRQSTDLSVVVTDADTRLPVGGSLVKLKFEEKEFRAKTDNLGVAYFKELKVGSYDVSVEASNYNQFAGKIDIATENLKGIELKRTDEGSAAGSGGTRVEETVAPAVAPKVSKEENTRTESIQTKEASIKNDEKSQIAQVLGESALIIYDAKGKVEKAVMKIADEFMQNKREAVIVAAQPRTNIYRSKLKQAIGSGKVKVVDLASDKQPTEGNEVLTSNLKAFESIFKEMPAGSVLIFDALSSLIIKEGGVMAYKFISDAIQYFSAEGLCLVCMIDRGAHDEREVKSFENLFVNLVNLEGDRFELLN